MAYLGIDPKVAYSSYRNIDDISASFDGLVTTFPLTVNGVAPTILPINEQQVLINVGGVPQQPDPSGVNGFKLLAGNIVFSSAPSFGETFWGVILATANYISANTRFADGSANLPSVTFASDVTTGVYSPGAGQLAISTDGTGRLFVDSSGNVGIGTSSPGHRLDVAGGVNSTGLNATGIGGFFNGASKFGVDNNAGATRMYSSGPDASTRGSFDFRTTDSVGTLDTSRMVIDSSGNVGIGTTSPSLGLLEVSSTNGVTLAIKNTSATVVGNEFCQLTFNNTSNSNANFESVKIKAISTNGGGNLAHLTFENSGTERARIDSSGRLLVGTSSSTQTDATVTGLLQIQSAATERGISQLHTSNDASATFLQFSKIRSTSIVQSGDFLGRIQFNGYDGSAYKPAATIDAQVDGTPGANDMPGRLVFSTTADGAASPTERMRIDSTGVFFVGTTASQPNPGFVVNPAGFNKIGNNAGANGWGFYDFVRSGVSIGSITQTGTTGVAYNTSSDYRLKENVTPVTDGITRLQQLNPSRFNFIADPNRTVDGFIAHEAQAVVPECVTGEKDAVDDDGNPKYQGIDQSKMVPLVVAALQECIKKVEALESELALLKSKP